MKKTVTIAFIILICSFANAQQISMYNHYYYKPMVYNPAFTGDGDATNAMLVSRSQWSGFKNNPTLNIFTLDGSLVPNKTGLGLTLISDKQGISTRTGGYLSYSYRLKINEDMHLMFGASLGIIDQTIDFSKAIVENTNDLTLFTGAQQKTTLDGNAGLAFVWKDLTLGAAVPQLLGNNVNYVDNTNIRQYYTQVRHYMTSLKYHYFISKEKGISIAPEGLVRFVPKTPFQFDGTVTVDYKSIFWIGTSYKSSYAESANIGFCIRKQLYIGYSYDFIIGNLSKYAGMSQEIMINYKFGKNKKTSAIADTAASKHENKVMQPPVYQKSEGKKEEALPEKQARLIIEQVNADRMNTLQAKVNQSEDKIKELKDKIQKAPVNDTMPHTLAPLNSVLIKQLQKKIEELLDNPKSSPAEIKEIRDDIASFLDSDIPDTVTSAKLKKNYELLNSQHQDEDAPSVLVRGTVIFVGSETLNNYSIVSITVTDKETGQIVGIYTPNSKNGQYLFILNPGRKYLVTTKTKGYQTYSEDFSPENKKESYEMTQEIRLKKE